MTRIAILIVLCCQVALDAVDAAQLITLSGREAGVALVLGDIAQAETLVTGSRFMVVNQETDPLRHQQAAVRADAAGLLTAGRLRVVLAQTWKPVLANASANLVVIPAGLAMEGLDPKALAVALAPEGGIAVIERPTTAWLQGLPPDITVSTVGELTILARGRLAGSDDWPQKYHGADANCVSEDHIVGTRFSAQWFGLPMQSPSFKMRMMIAAKGRIFALDPAGGSFKDLRLLVRDKANGALLWERRWAQEPTSEGAYLCAIDDRVLVALKDRIVCLAAANGAERATWRPDDRPEVNLAWMTQIDDVLLVLSGTSSLAPDARVDRNNDTVYQRMLSGDRLTALDATTGAVRWSWSAEGRAIDGRSLVAAEGRVFFGFWNKHLTCLDLKSGQQAWTHDLTTPALQQARNSGRRQIGLYSSHLPQFRAGQGVVAMGWMKDANMVVMDAADGRLLWHAWRGGNTWLMLKDRIVVFGVTAAHLEKKSHVGAWSKMPANSGMAYDLRSGAMREEAGAITRQCSESLATPNGYFSAIDGPAWDLKSATAINPLPTFRPVCGWANLPVIAGGAYVNYGWSNCICVFRFRDWTAWCPPQERTVTEPRLDVFSTARLEALSEDGRDWPQARGNPDHSGASIVPVGSTPAALWRTTPDHPYAPLPPGVYREDPPQLAPTPPVAVGTIVVAGGGDGAVRAWNTRTGAPLWATHTGGRIISEPAIMGGRVFAGSADGHLYCLGLADGAIRWRFRLAPNQQSIPVYGHLMSRWPVVGVLALNGTVYASAGMTHDDGGVVCAVDAETGQARWVSNFFADQEVVCPVGGMVAHGNQLWVRSAFSTVRLDLATGTPITPPVKDLGMVDGADIGRMAGSIIVQGGRPWFWEAREYYMRRLTNTQFTELGPDGTPLSPMVTMQSVAPTPAWDEQRMLGVYASDQRDRQIWSWHGKNNKYEQQWQNGYRGLECWQTPGMRGWLTNVRQRYGIKDETGAITGPVRVDWGLLARLLSQAKKADPTHKGTTDLPERTHTQWTDPDTWIHTLALAADTALVICRVPSPRNPKTTSHWLRCIDRDTGALRVEHELPKAPVFNGLAIDRDGRIIVALQDGSLVAYASPNLNGVQQ